MQNTSNLRRMALILALVLGLAGLGLALYEFFAPASGTTGTAGAALVTGSTALLAAAAALLAFVRMPGWLSGLLMTLFFLGTVATAVAGYFLMADLLVAAVLGALVAGLAAWLTGRGQPAVAS